MRPARPVPRSAMGQDSGTMRGHGARAGALLGLAAGSLPALMMQIACMYSPEHILAFHIGPALAVAGAGAALGAWLMRS